MFFVSNGRAQTITLHNDVAFLFSSYRHRFHLLCVPVSPTGSPPPAACWLPDGNSCQGGDDQREPKLSRPDGWSPELPPAPQQQAGLWVFGSHNTPQAHCWLGFPSHLSVLFEFDGRTHVQFFFSRTTPPGVLFCVGGRGGSGDPFRSIECYSIAKNSWFFGPEMNSRRRHVGVISVGGEAEPLLIIPATREVRDGSWEGVEGWVGRKAPQGIPEICIFLQSWSRFC